MNARNKAVECSCVRLKFCVNLGSTSFCKMIDLNSEIPFSKAPHCFSEFLENEMSIQIYLIE